MRKTLIVKLYGAQTCHKTRYYQEVLNKLGVSFQFLDVVLSANAAEELKSLYSNGKLNFPTITIGTKKLRNPKKEDLIKWIHKLIPQVLEIKHDKDRHRFVLNVNGEEAKVEYVLKNEKMHLVHSEVPYSLRGKGIGKELVLKTFEKLTEEGYKAVAVCSYVKAVKMRSEAWKNRIE